MQKNSSTRMKSRHNQRASEKLGELLREAHHRVEASCSERITQSEMAARLGLSARTYVDYLHGKGPAGARVVFDILAMLDDREAISILHSWRDGNRKSESGKSDEN